MGKMQQRKGKGFEELVANIIWSALGVWVGRNLSQHGEDAGRDLLTRLPFCLQCQHAKHIDPWQKLKEAQDSARPGEIPVAILRKDHKPIIAAMSIYHWLALVQAALQVEDG
jgi:hypothetical protein